MATDKRRQCGICGARARYMGSHVIYEHVPFAAGQGAALAALDIERKARAQGRTNALAALEAERAARVQSFADESAGAAEGYGTLADRPVWVTRLVAKDMTYSTGR